MKITLKHKRNSYSCDLSKPLDISLPLKDGATGPKCFYAPDFSIEPFKSGNFIGSVAAGAPVNFYNVSFNPHGNGTHTECIGHISKKIVSINKSLTQYHFIAQVISIKPEKLDNGDLVIKKEHLSNLRKTKVPKALIIRTLPNAASKRKKNYSGTNPPYLETAAMEQIVKLGIEHLLIDLPSVDREEDEGKLAGHKIYWNYPKKDRVHCTITEMIFVDFHISDGLYLLNVQIAPFELDATPSKPVLYKLKKIND